MVCVYVCVCWVWVDGSARARGREGGRRSREPGAWRRSATERNLDKRTGTYGSEPAAVQNEVVVASREQRAGEEAGRAQRDRLIDAVVADRAVVRVWGWHGGGMGGARGEAGPGVEEGAHGGGEGDTEPRGMMWSSRARERGSWPLC